MNVRAQPIFEDRVTRRISVAGKRVELFDGVLVEIFGDDRKIGPLAVPNFSLRLADAH